MRSRYSASATSTCRQRPNGCGGRSGHLTAKDDPSRWVLLGRAIQDPLQRDDAVESGGRYVTAVIDRAALRFLPISSLEEAGGLYHRPIDVVGAVGFNRD